MTTTPAPYIIPPQTPPKDCRIELSRLLHLSRVRGCIVTVEIGGMAVNADNRLCRLSDRERRQYTKESRRC